uniref:Somatomedin-B and thrombospondin type-1 domain-containing protein-like n=1 Tax=Saccoglossus kowalevskii TaxID=10224 RepID=A0ABM0MQR5_SACKO|nr:PREDICTED: somatomedin-B and thrombospondin type-1 domain-containing protein-like [Saccoglossus kowalevskii]
MSCAVSQGLRIDRRYGECFCDESCLQSLDCCEDYTHVCKPSDCQVSDWSHWSGCSVLCGIGYSERQRFRQKLSENGGVDCPPLIQRRGCYAGYCETNELMSNGIAMILPSQFGKARLKNNKIGPYRRKERHPSHCVYVTITSVHRNCVNVRKQQWTEMIRKDMMVCVECQTPAMMDTMSHCKGEGSPGSTTLWSAIGTMGCRGSWQQESVNQTCTCDTGYDFIFV